MTYVTFVMSYHQHNNVYLMSQIMFLNISYNDTYYVYNDIKHNFNEIYYTCNVIRLTQGVHVITLAMS